MIFFGWLFALILYGRAQHLVDRTKLQRIITLEMHYVGKRNVPQNEVFILISGYSLNNSPQAHLDEKVLFSNIVDEVH